MNNTQERQDMRRRWRGLKRKADRLREQVERLDERRSRVMQKLRSLRAQIDQIKAADAEWDAHPDDDTEEPRPPILDGQLPMFEGAFSQQREA